MDNYRMTIQEYADTAKAMFGPDSMDAQFYQWAADNDGRLVEAAIDMGLTLPIGPNILGGLRDSFIRKMTGE